jgi:hypothetical protein
LFSGSYARRSDSTIRALAAASYLDKPGGRD